MANILVDSNKPNKSLNNGDINALIEKKISYFQDLVQKTALYIHKNKMIDIISLGDETTNIHLLELINSKIKTIYKNEVKGHSITDEIIQNLQNINNDFSSLFKNTGTESLDDMLWICCGNNSISTYVTTDLDKYKMELLKKYFHPIGYKTGSSNKSDESVKKDSNNSNTNGSNTNIICNDLVSSFKTSSFYLKVNGLQITLMNPIQKKHIIIYGVVDDPIIDFFNNKYINHQLTKMLENIPDSSHFHTNKFDRYLKCLKLKHYFLLDEGSIYDEFYGILTQFNTLKQKPISVIIKDFMTGELFVKRNMIMNLLLDVDNNESTYLAYILYDLLPNDHQGNIDTKDQIMIFDSFSWDTKIMFKEAMTKTNLHMTDVTNIDTVSKISLEQQICLLRVPDQIKERAFQKLKEIKSKSDDSGSKARQYLDGLLKIPFGYYRKEPILSLMSSIKVDFDQWVKHNYNKKNNMFVSLNIDISKSSYNNLEIITYLKKCKTQLAVNIILDLENIKSNLSVSSKTLLVEMTTQINKLINTMNIKYTKDLFLSKKPTKKDLSNYIIDFINFFVKNHSNETNTLLTTFNDLIHNDNTSLASLQDTDTNTILQKEIQTIENKYNDIQKYMINVRNILDKSVHGHDNAKNQIERIIGQWINGEQTGYCFGFEGPPGVGKTSLAKRGLSECLTDEDGTSRPFAMIQMGGDSNGSSLHGHNYTYVGSTWGSIVQILMDKKCMNPIIFIDEIDKISKTEHGREIIGILTHLLDSTQNDCFQDKYFTGIDLDLSKALFILSYNDVDSIDRILLDRIHRIKFSGLSLEDKLTICEQHILPEIYTKIGLVDTIQMDIEVIKFVINEYTQEPGVRKLKEILFELIGEINLDILKNFNTEYNIPIIITIDDIKNKYFKDRRIARIKKVHEINVVGVINGLWANSLGAGGVIPIEVKWRPHEVFLGLHLTGSQGDSMKQSMDVATTLAWNLTPNCVQNEIMSRHSNDGHFEGLHIHAGDISTAKDGPSATGAITVAIYSLFNNKKIKCNVAMTGESCLSGSITEIGGLDLKILGAIKAGITEVIFPTENVVDFDKFMAKYKDNDLIKGIKFHPVSTIEEVFCLVFE